MRKSIVAMLAGAMIMIATSAMAVPILDFGLIAPTNGSISYGGGSAALVGSGITVDNVLGLDTLLNNNVGFNLLNGTLNFTTGNALSGSTATTVNFGGGANTSIILNGTVDVNSNGIVDTTDITGILLTGKFGSASVTTTNGFFRIAGQGFQDYKNPELLALYGIPGLLPSGAPIPFEGALNLSFVTPDSNLSDGFSSVLLLSGDLTNTPVPEPGTMMLLGIGMLGMAVYGKRRMNKQA